MFLFCGHMWQSKEDLPYKLQFGTTKSDNFVFCLKFLAILSLAPVAELLSLSLFIYYFMFPNTEKQVECNIYSESASNIFLSSSNTTFSGSSTRP